MKSPTVSCGGILPETRRDPDWDLAIAKSFVELQHGTLKISTEADLFKADIVMPKLEIPPEEEQAQEAQNL